MLIEFKVSNFRSIYKSQTFSMAAGIGTELEDNLITYDCDLKLRLSRASVIYGTNAGGKSNFLSALLFMHKFIIFSAKESQQGEKIRVDNFIFDKSSRNEPSEFEITFIKNKIRYQYGFSADTNQIFEEWLFAYPAGHAQKWFSRVYDKRNGEYSWKFSKYFKGGKQVSDLTIGNVLFLSNAVKLNNRQLAPIFDWFQKDLKFIDAPTSKGLNYKGSIELLKTKIDKKKLLQFMLIADSSISDINVDTKEIDINDFQFIPEDIKNILIKNKSRHSVYKVSLTHAQGGVLDLEEESEGTRKLLGYASCWIDALENGRILIVDELDNSLHPLVVRFLIKLICDPTINKKNSQIIFSTHDASLLDNELFRRDQVWFVEKDKSNSTQLYSLLEFSPRKNEAIGRGYLQGRYGALPYIGEWKF